MAKKKKNDEFGNPDNVISNRIETYQPLPYEERLQAANSQLQIVTGVITEIQNRVAGLQAQNLPVPNTAALLRSLNNIENRVNNRIIALETAQREVTEGRESDHVLFLDSIREIAIARMLTNLAPQIGQIAPVPPPMPVNAQRNPNAQGRPLPQLPGQGNAQANNQGNAQGNANRPHRNRNNQNRGM
ncbi:hypothetical protein [Aquimarina pacifica]|uniref:hypothetical protein n=1 Tax=Aquimarina pacifica TaxID=1296415 RepID=UPI00046FE1BF|nr:hypothetical protein [Aquimarina pacifica]